MARLVPIREATQELGGISRPKLYDLIAAGEIDTVRVGTRRMVVASSLDRYIDQHLDRTVLREESP